VSFAIVVLAARTGYFGLAPARTLISTSLVKAGIFPTFQLVVVAQSVVPPSHL